MRGQDSERGSVFLWRGDVEEWYGVKNWGLSKSSGKGGLGQRVFYVRRPRGMGGTVFSEQVVRPQLISNGY